MTIDITTIKPGDTVTLEHPEVGALTLPVEVPPASFHTKVTIPGFGRECIHDLLDRGWTITDHKPKVELPTEKNAVVYSEDAWAVARHGGGGDWFADTGAWAKGPVTVSQMLSWATDWVRLVPESENRAQIAAEVIDWFQKTYGWKPEEGADARKHFGVER